MNPNLDTKTGQLYCPYDSCEYSAPTEHQVRSHITRADHGEHKDVNGFSVDVDVLDDNDEKIQFKNKVLLDDITIDDITDDVDRGKQVILEIAHKNPTKSYTWIQEQAAEEGIEYGPTTVRRVVRTYLEAVPENNDTTSEETTTSEEATTSYQFENSLKEANPLSASPDQNSLVSDTDSEDREDNNPTPDRSDSQPDQTPTDQSKAQNNASSCGDFPYDTASIRDYWTPNQQKIIAIYEALDDPTAKDVHSKLADDFDIDVSKSYVQKTLNGWKKDDYSELNEKRKRAIDLLVARDENETFTDIAKRDEVDPAYLSYIQNYFPHILLDQGGELIVRKKELPEPETLPFDIIEELSDSDWTELQRIIISCYEALDDPFDREVVEKLRGQNVKITRQTVQKTISKYVGYDRRDDQLQRSEKRYDDLNERQQQAVDIIAQRPPDDTITSISKAVSENRRYLYYINDDYQHIIDSRRSEMEPTTGHTQP